MEIEVTVSRIKYRQDEGTWTAFQTDKLDCSGNIPWTVKPGDRLILDGAETTYNGLKQFKFKSAMPNIPADKRGLLQLTAFKTNGMGEVMEQALWDAYGDRWMDIDWSVEDNGAGIRGFTPAIRHKFRCSIAEVQNEKEHSAVLAFMLNLSFSHATAQSAWAKWGRDTLGRVNENPYALCAIEGVGFLRIDKSRSKWGVEDADPRRVNAALSCTVKQLSKSTGDTKLRAEKVIENMQFYIPDCPNKVLEETLNSCQSVIPFTSSGEIWFSTIALIKNEIAIATFALGQPPPQLELAKITISSNLCKEVEL